MIQLPIQQSGGKHAVSVCWRTWRLELTRANYIGSDITEACILGRDSPGLSIFHVRFGHEIFNGNHLIFLNSSAKFALGRTLTYSS